MRATLRRLAAAVGEHRRGLLGVGLVAAVLVVAALTIDAWSTTTYELEDSGVWVERAGGDDDALWGRLNTQIPEIDYAAPGVLADLVQDGRDVLRVSQDETTTYISAVAPDDPAEDIEVLEVPGVAVVRAGGGVAAVLVDGTVSVIRRGGPLQPVEEVAELGDGAALTVGVDGTVAGYDPVAGEIHLLAPGARDAEVVTVAEVADPDLASFALVGDQPVVLDTSGDEPRLLRPGQDPVGLGDLTGAVLQKTGPEAGAAVVASEEGVVRVDLGGGGIDEIADAPGGTPIRPAVDAACTYAAGWGPAGGMVAVCDGEEITAELDITEGSTFRTGGPAVVLNDEVQGHVHLVVEGRIESVTDWPDDEQEESERQVVEEEPPSPEDNEAPEATPDVGGVGEQGVGARPGRVTYLPVLRNDTDPDGDILVVDDEALELDDTSEGLVEVAHGGRAVQIDLRQWQEGDPDTITFSYVASDGQLTSQPAEVEVEVVTGAGHAPALVEGLESDLTVAAAAGAQVTHEVLSAFWDYDGDPLFLARASTSDQRTRVSWDDDGRVAFTADQPGAVQVALDVRDTTGASPGSPPVMDVVVEALGAPELAPVLNNDLVTVTEGQRVVVDPLANDVDPTGRGLALDGLPVLLDRGGPDDLADPEEVGGGRLAYTPAEAGDYVLLYRVEGAESDEIKATILLQVLEPGETRPPVIRPDVVVVEEGESATEDLLANDVDPDGNIVSITDLRLDTLTDEDGPIEESQLPTLLSASIQSDYRTLRVDLLPAAQRETYATYVYEGSDGADSLEATVTVVVVEPVGNRPPDTRPAEVAVRAGDAVIVPLTEFASDPDGDPLEVDVIGEPSVGDAAPSGDSIRFFAPRDAGGQDAVATVEVREATGNAQTEEIRFRIVGPEPDSAPEALDLDARVRAGGTVVVPVPLDGLDPDGDDVRLYGRTQARAQEIEVTEDLANQAFVIETTRDTTPGQVEFTYQLVDATGRRSADARVRVLVTPPVVENRPPVAMVDRLTASTSTTVFVDPVANDTDLDGDALVRSERLGRKGAEDLAPVVVETGDCDAEVTEEGLVEIRTADADEVCTVAYAVVDVPAEGDDPKSQPQEGQIVVSAVGGFEGVRPVARDDYTVADAGADSVEAVVLLNDDDRDGDPSAMEVTLVDEAGEAVDSLPDVALADGVVTVRLLDERRLVRYRVTDASGLTADAVVRVPARDENRPPQLREDAPEIVIQADAETGETIDLSDHIVDPDGDSDRISYDEAQAPKLDAGLLASELASGRLVVKADTRDAFGVATVQVVARDEEGDTASLPIPVTIDAADNRPPVWRDNPCREVVEDAPAQTLPLRADDADVGDTEGLTYAVSGTRSRGGVTVAVSGSSLTVSATTDADVGSTVSFTLTVDDGRDGEPQPLTCTLRVRRATGPPLSVAPTSITVEQGQTETVDVAALAANASGAIRIDGVTPSTGVTAQAAGSSIRVTAGEDARGEATVRYQVRDERDEADSQSRASGLITVRIVGKPDAPTGVVASQGEGAEVTVRWTPGNDNGAPITRFEVTGRGGSGGSKSCASSPCTLGGGDGIRAEGGAATQFVVVAVNEVGESPPSAASAGIVIDQLPSAPVITGMEPLGAADGQGRRVRFTWRPGPEQGSALTGYQLSGVPGAATVSASTTSFDTVVTEDGACLVVVAVNSKGDSPPSGQRCIEGSYGRPFVTAGLTATDTGDGNVTYAATIDENGPAGTVSWAVSIDGCAGNARQTGRGAVVEGRFEGCAQGGHSLRLAFSSRGGDGESTATVTVNRKPVLEGAPSIVPSFDSVRVTGLPGFTSAGSAVTTWRVGSASGPAVAVDGEIPASGATTIQVVGCAGDLCSDPSTPSGSATPYTTAPTPEVSAERRTVEGVLSETIDVSWTWADPGNGRNLEYELTATWAGGGIATATGPAFDLGVAITASFEEVTVTVRVVDTADARANSGSDQAVVAEVVEEPPPCDYVPGGDIPDCDPICDEDDTTPAPPCEPGPGPAVVPSSGTPAPAPAAPTPSSAAPPAPIPVPPDPTPRRRSAP